MTSAFPTAQRRKRYFVLRGPRPSRNDLTRVCYWMCIPGIFYDMIRVLEFTSLTSSKGVIPLHSLSQTVRSISVFDRFTLYSVESYWIDTLHQRNMASRIVYVIYMWCVMFRIYLVCSNTHILPISASTISSISQLLFE